MELTNFQEKDYYFLPAWIKSTEFNFQWGGPAFSFPLTIEQVASHCSKPDIYPFLFQVQGQVAGYIEFRRMPTDSCRICRVLVLESHRGKGLAKEMLKLVISNAKKETGYDKFSLSVFQHNTAAVALYKSMGFEITSTEVRPEKISDKTWVALEMEARL